MVHRTNPKIVCIIQARMGSSRLPGKVMMMIDGTPMVGHCLNRLKLANSIDEIVLATTDLDEDNDLYAYVEGIEGVSQFRGDAEDVLSRYRQCADRHEADIIIRATADNPLVDPNIIDEAVKHYLENKNTDYCSNKINPSFPMGFDIEVFSGSVLRMIDNETTDKYDREHVTPPILKQPERFVLTGFESEVDNSDLRVTVDYASDFELIRKVITRFAGQNNFTCDDVVKFLRQNPSLVILDEILLNDMKKKRGELR